MAFEDVPGTTPLLGVSDFVGLVNQAMEYAFGSVLIQGELANFRVSKNRWVYFDLKDDAASVRFFGTVYNLPGPLEDGMMLEVRGTPRLHPQFGFSVTVQSMRPTGEGAIRKAAELLQAKLAAEGLFDADRKRMLPYPPRRIGLVTSAESAAYADFIKILNARWGGVAINLVDVQVQGERAPAQIVEALQWFNQQAAPVDVLVVIRGGGSADDLQAFSTEAVVRAVAASRVPTLVAIGHEVDVSLAELAADVRASTPSNAAETLVPDKRETVRGMRSLAVQLQSDLLRRLHQERRDNQLLAERLADTVAHRLERERATVQSLRQLANAYNPALALQRGYAVVRDAQGRLVRHGAQVRAQDRLQVRLYDSELTVQVAELKGVEHADKI